MSKRIDATITCPHCETQFQMSLYRTIWGEYPENRALVMDDSINVAHCKACGIDTKLVFPLMYTNTKEHFAVWWEPYPDAQMDQDSQGYAKMFGQGNFYQTAPRIKDWSDFKKTIVKFETGELKGKPIQISDEQKKAFEGALKGVVSNLGKEQKGKGCVVTLFFLLAGMFSAGYCIFKVCSQLI
jgi:hypothetical protein